MALNIRRRHPQRQRNRFIRIEIDRKEPGKLFGSGTDIEFPLLCKKHLQCFQVGSQDKVREAGNGNGFDPKGMQARFANRMMPVE